MVGWCRHQGRTLTTTFEARRAAGRVRECHGDLHLANIALIDGEAQLFDAIEFNPALRWIDCVADIAFVVMDLAAHGRADLAWRFLNRWLEHTGDYAGLSVLRYYGAYRALVRARVAALRLNPTCGDGSAQAVQALEEYLELAAGFAGQRRARWPVARPAALWLAHGFSGAGKSTHALTLACQRGLVRVRADVERKRLFGLAPNASSDGVPGGIYTAEATFRTHQRLAQVAREVLVAGYSVIVDATLLDRDARALFLALADSVQVPCHILSFEAPLPVLRERVRQRAGRSRCVRGGCGRAGRPVGPRPPAAVPRRGDHAARGHHGARELGPSIAALIPVPSAGHYIARCPGMKYSNTLVITR